MRGLVEIAPVGGAGEQFPCGSLGRVMRDAAFEAAADSADFAAERCDAFAALFGLLCVEFRLPFRAPLLLQPFYAVRHAVRGGACNIQTAAILFWKALLHDPHHRAGIVFAAFEDDFAVLQ